MIPERQDTNRRGWMLRVLQTAGASAFALQLLGQEHAHEAGDTLSEKGAMWKPLFLSNEQNEQLVSVGERIIPGSKAASCNRVIDLVLSLEPEATRQKIVTALATFDAQAKQQHQKPFHELQSDEQDQIIATAANAGEGDASDAFRLTKEWVADAYWSSQQGMRELGWTGRMAWAKFDGCAHAGAHS